MNRTTALAVALMVASTLLLSGCAAVFNTPQDTISIQTTPPGASVKIKGETACEPTPCAVVLPNNTYWTLSVQKPGFKSADVLVSRSVNYWWVVPDLMFGSIFAVLFDVFTESMYTLSPDDVRVALVEEGQPGLSMQIGPRESFELREDKELELLAGVLFRDAIGSGISITGGFYMSPDIILEATADISFSLAGANHFAQTNEHFGLQLKAFIENSLFVTFGAGLQNIVEDLELELKDLVNATESSFRVSYQQLGVSAGIGNQWQYRSFTVGVHWLDLFFPLQHSRLRIIEDSFSAAEVSGQRADADAFLKDDLFPSFRLFHIQLGASF